MKYRYEYWLFVTLIMIIGIFIYTPYVVSAMDIATITLSTKETDLAPFYWTVAIVGGVIAITLSYVSWKKYKGDEKKRPKNDPNS